MSRNTLAKAIASKEYREKHNYMAIPGDTQMPEYSNDEVEDIESGKMKQCDIAKKYGRSLNGIQSKKYRMSGKYKTNGAKKKEDHQNMIRFMAGGMIKITKKESKRVSIEEVDAFLGGEMSIEAFLSAK